MNIHAHTTSSDGNAQQFPISPGTVSYGTSIRAFKQTIWAHYKQAKRDLPWRKTSDPYRILVSEIMLQQTQAERVAPKYEAFIKRFPTVSMLAQAELREVFVLWQGLGYNRRAKMLHEAARVIEAEHNGSVPGDEKTLLALKGVGPYTAGAILAFAYNKPAVAIETNIRSVFIHFFFPDRERVSDKDIIPLIKKTVDRKRPREWYNALMDYGAKLKREGENPSRKSAHHAKQSPFKGSNREIRGAIIRTLVEESMSFARLARALKNHEKERVLTEADALLKEGLLKLERRMLSIA